MFFDAGGNIVPSEIGSFAVQILHGNPPLNASPGFTKPPGKKSHGESEKNNDSHMGMDQYLLIPFLVG